MDHSAELEKFAKQNIEYVKNTKVEEKIISILEKFIMILPEEVDNKEALDILKKLF